MANSAQQLKEELTQKARENEVCKTRLLDWVASQFRAGENPVRINCTNLSRNVCQWINGHYPYEENEKMFSSLAEIKRGENGRIIAEVYTQVNGDHYKGRNIEVDITDTDFACSYAFDGIDEQYKRLFLESEGFKVVKTWIPGRGGCLEIYY